MDKQFMNNVAKYIQASTTELDRLRASEASLLDKVASLQKTVQVQKEASQQPLQQCQPEVIASLADNVIRAGFVKEANRRNFIDNCMNSPLELIPFLDKLATLTIKERGLPVLGAGVDKEAQATAVRGSSSSDEQWKSFIGNLARKTEMSEHRR